MLTELKLRLAAKLPEQFVRRESGAELQEGAGTLRGWADVGIAPEIRGVVGECEWRYCAVQ